MSIATKIFQVLSACATTVSVHALAQLPRGEKSESMSGDSESVLGAILIFGAVAVYSAFKKSRTDGIKVASFFAALAVLYAFLPGLAMSIVALLAGVFAIGLFVSML